MSPDQPGRRHGDKWFHMTPWRLATIGAYFCLGIYGFVDDRQEGRIQDAQHRLEEQQRSLERQQQRIDRIAVQGRTAICVEVNFLENSLRVTNESVKIAPPEAKQRLRDSSERLSSLIIDLRAAVPGCPVLK